MSGVEAHPVNSSLMAVQNLNAFDLHSDEVAQIFSFGQLLPEHREIPDPDSRIQRGRNNEILLMVELRAHDVVRVAGDNVHTSPALVIPNPHGLVIAGGDNPRQLMMEEGRPDIVDVSFQRKQASLLLVVPHLHHCVVAARHK